MSHQPRVSKPVAVGLAVLGGALVAVQGRLSGQLAVYLGHDGIYAAALSLSLGLIALALIMAALPKARHSFAEIPALVRTKVLRPWELFGGLAGGFFVASQGIVVPRAGVAPFTISTVAGQTANSVVVDKYGLAPGGRRPLTWQRVTAAVLTVLAVAIAVAGRPATHSFSWFLVLLPLTAGALAAFQQAFNAKVGVMSGSTVAAALMNFIVAVGALWAATGIEHLISGKPLHTPPGLSNFWMYVGGLMGATFIAIGALAVGVVGVLVFGLAAVLGQLIGSVLIDAFFPTAGSHLGWNTLVAVTITAGAMVLAALSHRWSRTAPL